MLTQEELQAINRYAKAELTEDQVYTFSVRLCDNEVDRDMERFATEDLERLGELFAALSAEGLEPKRLQLLSYGPSSPPYAVLVEAVKEGGPGLEILPVHYQTESAH